MQYRLEKVEVRGISSFSCKTALDSPRSALFLPQVNFHWDSPPTLKINSVQQIGNLDYFNISDILPYTTIVRYDYTNKTWTQYGSAGSDDLDKELKKN